MRRSPTFLVSVLSCLSLTISACAFDAASASNEFGLELFRELTASRSENILISPYSLSSAFAPLYFGAAGETRAEIKHVFHFPENISALQTGFTSLREKITLTTPTGPNTPNSSDASPLQVFTANGFFAQKELPIRDSYRESLARITNASDFIQSLDFLHDTESARKVINSWIAKNTAQKIPAALPSGTLSSQTQLVLANTVYFKGTWENTFDDDLTQLRPFHIRDAKTTEDRTTMRRVVSLSYSREKSLQVVALPYAGGDFQCLILLPNRDTDITRLSRSLTCEQFQKWAHLPESELTLIDLQLPRFEFSHSAANLRDTLGKLGLKTAFDLPAGSANFDPLSPRQKDRYLAVSDVLHSTYIAFDEDGTEAAATTTIQLVTLGISSKPRPKPLVVHVDRPFIFAIQHRPTGTCIFLGSVVDPK